MSNQYQPLSSDLLLSTINHTIDTDSTLNTYELAIRCNICYDIINTALTIDICSHTYCALCIRRSLYFVARCPTCSVSCNSNNLHTNRFIDVLIVKYNDFKLKLAQSLSKQILNVIPKQTVINIDHPCPSDQSHSSSASGMAALFSTVPSSRKRQKLNKLECPICLTLVIESQINTHLDACLGVPSNAMKHEKLSLHNSADSDSNDSTHRSAIQLPVYSLLKEKQIKDLLKQSGLPVHGDRDQLIRRHTEYVLCVQADNDRVHPVGKDELVREIMKKESKQNSNITNRLGKQATLLDVFTNKTNTLPSHRVTTTRHKQPSTYNIDHIIVLDEKSNDNNNHHTHPSPNISYTPADTNSNDVIPHSTSPPVVSYSNVNSMNIDNASDTDSDSDEHRPSTQAEMFDYLIAQYKRKQKKKLRTTQQQSQPHTTVTQSISIDPTPVPITHTIQHTTPTVTKPESQCWRAIYHDKLKRVFYYNTMSHIGQFEKPDNYHDNT